MNGDFLQYLTLLLIGLLFARDLVWAVFKKKGLVDGKDDFTKKVCDLESHAQVANEEMGQVKERLTRIETNIDVIMRHMGL